MRIIYVFLMTLAIVLAPHVAQAQGAFGQGPLHIAAKLVSESDTPAVGEETTIAFVMKPDAGWHGYWENPGDAGLGMSVKWSLPKGVTVGALRYPVPETLTISGLMNHVYEGPYAILAPLTLAKDVPIGTMLPISVKADWLACTDKVCVPQSAELHLQLKAGDGHIDSARRNEFDEWRGRLPRPLGSEAHYSVEGDVLRFSIPFPASAQTDDIHLFALNDGFLTYAATQNVNRVGDQILIETKKGESASGQFNGVLRIGNHRGFFISAEQGVVPTRAPSLSLIWVALGGAILGGLLLNVMPCVFPILGLKALSLAKAGGDEGTVRREALAYAAGVIVACLLLGGGLLVLRAAGVAVGWAFQLQDPRIILLLLLLVTAISLNLLGAFALPTIGGGQRLAGQGGIQGAFWTGALVAFVATPCTGPFMGAAMGAALVVPVPLALLIFAGLGLGLALPFVALAYIPSLRRKLPKPGPWMVRLQRILAVPMILTAFGLVWLLGQQRGEAGWSVGIAAACVLAALLWFFGREQSRGRSRAGLITVAIIVLFAGGIAVLPKDQPQRSAIADGTVPFDVTRLAALRAQKTPVFLYFTANWCLTCKANEAAAIDRKDTRAAFEKAGAVIMVGDWTNADPAITRFLESQGRSGVPLYLWYAPGQEPRALPQILTPSTLTGLVH